MKQSAVTGPRALAAMWLASLAGPILAQETPARTDVAESDTKLQEVVVTGSLIHRDDYVSQSPLVTVQQSTLQTVGPAGTIDRALSELPQFVPVEQSRTHQAFLNLRGLGSNRMLVLVDGERVQPSSPDGSVDLNTIPTALVQSIETITGGASSVYGSDAITGVVNIKLLDHYNGAKVDVQYDRPEIGGGQSADASLVAGTDFADKRGSVIAAFDYSMRGQLSAGENPFYRVSIANAILPLGIVNFGANAPSQAAVNSVFSQYGFAPGTISPSNRFGANYDGTLFTPGPINNYKGPVNANFFPFNGALTNSAGRLYDLVSPMHRENFYTRATYNLNDNVQLYSSILLNHSEVVDHVAYDGLGLANVNGSVPTTNPFIPASLATLLGSRAQPNAPFALTYLFNNLSPIDTNNDYRQGQATVGAKGAVGTSSWTWDVYGTYGRTTSDEVLNAFSLTAVQSLLNAPDGGASQCQGGLNVFGPPSQISSACNSFIGASGDIASKFTQTVVNGSVEGKILDLPAGELRTAFGLDYRDNTYVTQTDPHFQTGDLVPLGIILPSGGSQSVREAYTELLVPVVKNLPLVKSFNLDFGYRYSDYSTSGGANTYKLDFDWTAAAGVGLRGGYARAIRAPSLQDLYAPATVTTVALGTPAANNKLGDPCDTRSSFRKGPNAAQVAALCEAQGIPAGLIDTYTYQNASVFPTTLGNSQLNPEIADTYTFGVVWRPTLDPELFNQLQTSVDYWTIKVSDAIGTVPFATALSNCFNGNNASNPTFSNNNVFCSSIARNSLGQITGASQVKTLNLASYRTTGLDMQWDWRVPFGALGLNDRFGYLNLNLVGTRLYNFIVQTFPSAAPINFAGTTSGTIENSVLPRWRAVTTLTYGVGPATIGARWRYLNAVEDVTKVTTVGSTVPGVPTFNYVDLLATWKLHVGQDVDLRGSVTNLTNKGIPQVGATLGITDPATYDVVGRTYSIGFSMKLF
jgi:iron complex outermembrane recepter protein